MPKQVQFKISDEEHKDALEYTDDAHLSYEAKKAFIEWLGRRKARTRRAKLARGEQV